MAEHNSTKPAPTAEAQRAKIIVEVFEALIEVTGGRILESIPDDDQRRRVAELLDVPFATIQFVLGEGLTADEVREWLAWNLQNNVDPFEAELQPALTITAAPAAKTK